MKIINNVDKYFNYEKLVKDVFKNLQQFKEKVITIIDCEPSKRVYLEIDNEEYWIRYNIIRCSEKSWSCYWTLFENDKDRNCGKEISEGRTNQIKYIND